MSASNGKLIRSAPYFPVADIVRKNMAAGEEVRLTTTLGDDSYPDWHPNNGHIVFTSNCDGDYGLYVMCTDGSDQKKITFGADNEKYPRWSPDGKAILYQSDHSGRGALYVIDYSPSASSCRK